MGIADILSYLHAGLGGVALIAGGIALATKKGATVHKRSGKVFYYSMLLSVLLSFIVSVLPGHESPFLFSIGVFSAYFLLSGYRSLGFKHKEPDLKWDKLLAYAIILTGFIMISYPIVLNGKMNIVLLVFGIVGIAFGWRDLRKFQDLEQLRKVWLKLHLGKMTGGYIAAVTAFFVVNQILPGVWNWFVPGMLGSVFISYWMRRLNPKKRKLDVAK